MVNTGLQEKTMAASPALDYYLIWRQHHAEHNVDYPQNGHINPI